MHRNVLSQTSHLLPGCACCFCDYLFDVQEFQVLLGQSESVHLTCKLKVCSAAELSETKVGSDFSLLSKCLVLNDSSEHPLSRPSADQTCQ